MPFTWHEILGTLGVGIILLAYIGLQIERLRSGAAMYSVMNAVGAVMILVSLWYEFNLPAFLMEFFWLVVSLFGIGKYLLVKRI